MKLFSRRTSHFGKVNRDGAIVPLHLKARRLLFTFHRYGVAVDMLRCEQAPYSHSYVLPAMRNSEAIRDIQTGLDLSSLNTDVYRKPARLYTQGRSNRIRKLNEVGAQMRNNETINLNRRPFIARMPLDITLTSPFSLIKPSRLPERRYSILAKNTYGGIRR